MQVINFLDRMSELGSAGAHNTASALEMLVGDPVTTTVPAAHELYCHDALDALAEMVSDEEWGVLVDVREDLDGTMLLLFPSGDRYDYLKGLESTDGVEDSAYAEMGNILASRFLIGIADVLSVDARFGPPATAYTVRNAILESFIATISHIEPFLVIQSTLVIDGGRGRIEQLFSPGPATLSLLTGWA